MNWYYHTVDWEGQTLHGYIKADNTLSALSRLQKDDIMWKDRSLSYNGIVSEEVAKKNVDFSDHWQKRGFERGFIVV